MIKNPRRDFRREIECIHGITLRPEVFVLLRDLYRDQRRLSMYYHLNSRLYDTLGKES